MSTSRARARAKAAQEKFIAALAESGNVTEACRHAKMSRTGAYQRRERDKAFGALWDEAVEISTDLLEKEARRRAVTGWDEPVFHDGKKVGSIRKYSDRMLEILLKGHRPEKFRERVDLKHSGRLTLEQLVDASGKTKD